MGTLYNAISQKHQQFIEAQKMFFVATAAPDGLVNVSPKGLDVLRMLDANRVIWLNLTGSGNETAAHLLQNDRMTVMFCAFEGKPRIMRLFGHTKTIHHRDAEWDALINLFPDYAGARQIYDMTVDNVQTSCGFGVPLFDYVGSREMLAEGWAKRGKEGVHKYWKRKNTISLDGKPTGLLSS